MADGCEKPNTGPLDLITTNNPDIETTIDGKKYYYRNISAKGIPLPFPIVSEAPILRDQVDKVTEEISILLKKLEIIKTCRGNLFDLLKDMFNEKDIPKAINKGNKAAIVLPRDGKGDEVLITNDNLFRLFGYPTSTDASGNPVAAQKIKEKIIPELSNDRLIGVFNDWLIAISKK